MTEPLSGAAQPPHDGPGPLQPSLDSLRSEGAWRLDPARFRYLEALARRLAGQPEPVRRLLQDRLQQAVADYAGRLAQAHASKATGAVVQVRPIAVRPAGQGTCAPLAQLNQYIRGTAPAGPAAQAPGDPQQPGELASVIRFRQAWSSSRARQQVEQAVARRPANAGPLNSHVLLLQSLSLMQELSPQYLQRFVAHVEALQWLDQAGEKIPRQPGKPGRTVKPGRTAQRGRPAK